MGKKLPRHYSGRASIRFWEAVNELVDPGMKIYSLGCQLQNLEDKVVDAIKAAEPKTRNRKQTRK